MRLFDIFRRDMGMTILPILQRHGYELTPEAAMSLAAVHRAVSIIATTGAQLPLQVFRGEEEVTPAVAKRPDMRHSTFGFWRETFAALAVHGEVFWWVTRNDRDELVNLEVLDNDEVGFKVDDDGTPKGRITYLFRGSEVRNTKIRHVRLYTHPGGIRGYGPIQLCKPDIQAVMRLRDYGNAIFDTGQVPTGVLSTDQFLNQEQADQYRAAWNKVQQERGIAVLGSGMQYTPILLNPEDAQFIANQEWSVNQVARMFGIPSILLASGIDGTSMTYSNVGDLFRLFLTTTLLQYLMPIEEAFSDLLPRGQEARFKVDSLLRTDLTSRVAAYQTLVTIGAMTPEEVRFAEGMFPVSGTNGSVPPPHHDGSPT